MGTDITIVVSLGRDGLPRGTRWDMDLRASGRRPPSLVSFGYFISILHVSGH